MKNETPVADMTALLERWHELEPERCEGVNGNFILRLGDKKGFGKSWVSGMNSPVERAIIQASVQGAVEARGWEWGMNSTGTTEPGRYGAWVASEFYEKEQWDECNSETPADALLSAYLEALSRRKDGE